ncbi:hypothetical protein C0989_012154 [Termitomyces sp. Mn162]|nr:hypothetical protein C0989_012154 [Termitomyces sp. Mn162]
MDKRVEIASNFLLQSPPGEINDVINDVRNIVSDDDLLKEGLLPAIRTYNLAQFIVVDVPGTDHQVNNVLAAMAFRSVISEVAREAAAACTSSNPEASEEEGEGKAEDAADEERFLDPRSMTSFVFNHLSLEASDIHKVDPNPDSEPFRYVIRRGQTGALCAEASD